MIDFHTLFDAAREVRLNAHAPYSGFAVGAAILGAGGGVHVGANVENAAYPQSQCAEASAIGAMVAAGETAIAAILVLGDGPGLCTPCGGCRQRIREFARPDTPIHVRRPDGSGRDFTLAELLPESFGPENLGSRNPGAGGPADRPTALRVVAARAPGFAPICGIVTGSGLATLAEAVEGAIVIPYADLPGFPRTGASGHPGRLILGLLGGRPVAVLQGRAHGYEGNTPDAMAGPIDLLRDLGARAVILTNAAGSLDPALPPGAPMAITDQINLTGRSPLTGRMDPSRGPRHTDMTDLYDPALIEASGLLERGVYLGVAGPQYETAAEIEAFRRLGARAVGMSTVHEAMIARNRGLRVAGVSVITNLATGLSSTALDGDHIVAVGKSAAGPALAAVRGILDAL